MKKHRYKLITTGILFTTATAIIHFMNHLISTTAIMKDLLKSTASNYYNWRFGKIYYTKQGTGSPVLLIHDLTIYSSAYEWEALVNSLRKIIPSTASTYLDAAVLINSILLTPTIYMSRQYLILSKT